MGVSSIQNWVFLAFLNASDGVVNLLATGFWGTLYASHQEEVL